MGDGRRRAARWVCFTAAAACGVFALAMPARAQEEESAVVPDIFRGAATSSVAAIEADRAALLPIEDLFRFVALDGSTFYETDRQTSRASLLFPGNGLILGPNLACGTFGGQFPDDFKPLLDTCTRYDYPLSVWADATTPTKATSGSLSLGSPTDPVSGEAIAAKAHAGPDASTSYAAMNELRVLGLPAFGPISLPQDQLELDTSVLTVESALSRTDQRIEAGVLKVDSMATLSGVRMVGGLIRIASLKSVSSVTDDAAGKRTAHSSFEVGGVTVAGVPAQITEDGLIVGSPSGGSGPLQQQLQTALNQVLQAMNIKISLLDTEETLDDGTGQAVAAAGGLLLEMAVDAQGLPTIPGPIGELDPNGTYVGTIQLGNTAAAGGAADFGIDDVFDVDAGLPGMTDDVPFDFDDGATFDQGSTGFADVAAPPSGTASRPTPDSPPAQQLVRSLTDPFGGRMGLVYLSFMFTVLGLCLLPRFTLSARLPGPGS